MIRERIKKFIVDSFLYGNEDGLGNDISLTQSGIIDSTGILELISFLEKEFAVTFQDDELVPQNLDSIELISEFIVRKAAV
jgi:acyl carrier protein